MTRYRSDGEGGGDGEDKLPIFFAICDDQV